jgi:hypothetical protein
MELEPIVAAYSHILSIKHPLCFSFLSILFKCWVKCINPFISWRRLWWTRSNSSEYFQRVSLCLCTLLSLLSKNLAKEFPAAKHNCWKLRLLCYSYRIVTHMLIGNGHSTNVCMDTARHLHGNIEIMERMETAIAIWPASKVYRYKDKWKSLHDAPCGSEEEYFHRNPCES